MKVESSSLYDITFNYSTAKDVYYIIIYIVFEERCTSKHNLSLVFQIFIK